MTGSSVSVVTRVALLLRLVSQAFSMEAIVASSPFVSLSCLLFDVVSHLATVSLVRLLVLPLVFVVWSLGLGNSYPLVLFLPTPFERPSCSLGFWFPIWVFNPPFVRLSGTFQLWDFLD